MEKEKGVRFWQGDLETWEDYLLYITKWKVFWGKYWTFWHLKIVTYKVNLVKKQGNYYLQEKQKVEQGRTSNYSLVLAQKRMLFT